jgi:hypothetical protein
MIKNTTVDALNIPRSKAIIVKPSPPPSVAHSTRTIRRVILATELSESDRQNLLWERQRKDLTVNARLKWPTIAPDLETLQECPGLGGSS